MRSIFGRPCGSIPGSPKPRAIGELLYESGSRKEAAAEFETVLRLNPNDASAARILERLRADTTGP